MFISLNYSYSHILTLIFQEVQDHMLFGTGVTLHFWLINYIHQSGINEYHRLSPHRGTCYCVGYITEEVNILSSK